MLLRWLKENRGIDIDLDKIDFEDKNVYKMIGEGKTAGVFQLESPGMTSFMKELKPDCLEDIIAGISLYRPGPMSEIPKIYRGKEIKTVCIMRHRNLKVYWMSHMGNGISRCETFYKNKNYRNVV